MKLSGKGTITLKISDVVIRLASRFPLETLTEQVKQEQRLERYEKFFCKGNRTPHINVKIKIVNKLPAITKKKRLFVTYHFEDGSENWRLFKNEKGYIFTCPLANKKQLMVVNKTFDKVTAYLLPKKSAGYVWTTSDIIYDFLQILLINYLAQRNQGIFTHAIGVKDIDGRGFVFAGKSGDGKTTTARLWHKHTKAMVLNDDRIIVRKEAGTFVIYGSPWHGEFSDYLDSKIESARLNVLFFIHHSSKNVAEKVSGAEAFKLLYPALFPTFWDKEGLESIASLCQHVIKNVPCYRLGFVNDKSIITFVRKLSRSSESRI
ncbi:MAG: hypothetical protein JW938_01530 [Candidatus Omnitrophica bacterium]|nr:hypothetical protein [Candidatus Omnitrophota bacterium]